jgi:hypothetical protein
MIYIIESLFFTLTFIFPFNKICNYCPILDFTRSNNSLLLVVIRFRKFCKWLEVFLCLFQAVNIMWTINKHFVCNKVRRLLSLNFTQLTMNISYCHAIRVSIQRKSFHISNVEIKNVIHVIVIFFKSRNLGWSIALNIQSCDNIKPFDPYFKSL